METFMSADTRVLVGLTLSTTTTKRTPTVQKILQFQMALLFIFFQHLFLNSKRNKSTSNQVYYTIYRAARQNSNSYHSEYILFSCVWTMRLEIWKNIFGLACVPSFDTQGCTASSQADTLLAVLPVSSKILQPHV